METVLQNIRFVKRFVSNMEHISAKHPIIGSIMEQAWLMGKTPYALPK